MALFLYALKITRKFMSLINRIFIYLVYHLEDNTEMLYVMIRVLVVNLNDKRESLFVFFEALMYVNVL